MVEGTGKANQTLDTEITGNIESSEVNLLQSENHENDDFYEGMAQAADFVHDRLGPTGLNNTVEEYVKDEEQQGRSVD